MNNDMCNNCVTRLSRTTQLNATLSNQGCCLHSSHRPVFSIVWFEMKNTCAEVLGHRILKQTFDTERKPPRLPVTLYTPLTHGFAQSDHHKRNQRNHLINKMAGNPNTLQQQPTSLYLSRTPSQLPLFL